MTSATKCQYESDESIALAATYIDFAVNRLNNFDKVTASTFEDASDMVLLQYMSAAIKNGTFLNPNNTPTMAMIAKITSDVDYLICISRLLQGQSVVSLICTYVVTTMISVKPQSWDPVMREGLKREQIQPPDNPFDPISQLDITIYHLPKSAGLFSAGTTISASHLTATTVNAARYLASLGHNVFLIPDSAANSGSGRLYILFDSVEMEDALEAPGELLLNLASVIVGFVIAWGFVDIALPRSYSRRLHWNIQEIMTVDKNASRILNCTHDPLAFEGYQMIPKVDEHHCQASRDIPMVVLENESATQLLSVE